MGVVCEILTPSPCLLNPQQQGPRWAGAVVEYSELPAKLREGREEVPSGAHEDPPPGGPYTWANICMHYFSLDFLEAVAANAEILHCHYHSAKKKIPELRSLQGLPGGPPAGSSVVSSLANWGLVTPDKPNGWKLELFIFDVFPLADRVMVRVWGLGLVIRSWGLEIRDLGKKWRCRFYCLGVRV